MNLRKHIDALTVFIIVFLVIGIVTFGLRTDLNMSEEKRQSFENKLLETIITNYNKSLVNDKIFNHNEAIVIHNQKVIVAAESVEGHSNKTPFIDQLRTDFIPIGNETIER